MTASPNAPSAGTSPHPLRAIYDGGFWSVEVDCPDEAMGAKRPCAVWEDGDGSKRIDQCTFQQYATDCDPEEWLHGRIEFPVAMLAEGGFGEDWHAIPVEMEEARRG